MDFSSEDRKLLWWLLVATSGGEKRVQIIKILKKDPQNINKLREILNVNYRTIEHHIKILLDNRIIQKMGNGYGAVYFLSDYYQVHFNLLEDVISGRK